jgi:ATP-binding cassette subfamily B protein
MMVLLPWGKMPKPSLSFIDVLTFAAKGYWRRQPVRLGAIFLLFAISAGLETYLPTALSDFIGAIRNAALQDDIIGRLLIFLGIQLLLVVLTMLTFLIYNAFETKVFRQLVDDVYRHVHRLPETFFVNTFAGSIISKINRARSRIETFEDRLLIDIYYTALILLGSLLFMSRDFPLLALILLLYLIIMLVVSAYVILAISGPAQGRYADAQDEFVAHMADGIGGMATSKAYAQEPYEVQRLQDNTRRLRKVNLRAYYLSNMAGLSQRLLLWGLLALMLGGGVWYYFQGQANVEHMAYLAFAYTIIQSHIQRLGFQVKDLLTASYDLHGVIHLLREPPEVEAETQPDLTIQRGTITFDQVSFAYPGKTEPVFRGLSIEIKVGERVALVGHSGSGKTTFIRLLQQLYAPDGGRILIDGQDIAQHSRHSLRRAIALVPQEPILFHRSLAENIAYARPEASLEAIQQAAQQAQIADFIASLPQGYDTLVGERGIKLSGGERQRIAIARAILADRPILILDEATSSLDSANERAIQEALHRLTQGRTAIMIAHRLSTIQEADRILVFHQGQIVEQGSHRELIAIQGGHYARLHALQSGGFLGE